MTSNERPLILLTALFVTGFLFVVFYLIWPLCSSADGVFQKRDEYSRREAELDTSQSYHANIRETQKELDKNNWGEMRKKISINFTNNDPVFLPKIYYFFQQICQSHSPSLTLNSVSGSGAALKEGGGGALKENGFNLSINTSYDTFKAFLAELESQSLLIDIKEVSFSSVMPAEPTKKDELVSGIMPFNLVLAVPSY